MDNFIEHLKLHYRGKGDAGPFVVMFTQQEEIFLVDWIFCVNY